MGRNAILALLAKPPLCARPWGLRLGPQWEGPQASRAQQDVHRALRAETNHGVINATDESDQSEEMGSGATGGRSDHRPTPPPLGLEGHRSGTHFDAVR